MRVTRRETPREQQPRPLSSFCNRRRTKKKKKSCRRRRFYFFFSFTFFFFFFRRFDAFFLSVGSPFSPPFFSCARVFPRGVSIRLHRRPRVRALCDVPLHLACSVNREKGRQGVGFARLNREREKQLFFLLFLLLPLPSSLFFFLSFFPSSSFSRSFQGKNMTFYDEIEIEDMEWNEELRAYTFACPCGDVFQITRVSFFFLFGAAVNHRFVTKKTSDKAKLREKPKKKITLQKATPLRLELAVPVSANQMRSIR